MCWEGGGYVGFPWPVDAQTTVLFFVTPTVSTQYWVGVYVMGQETESGQ
jgi:hypothetical protein